MTEKKDVSKNKTDYNWKKIFIELFVVFLGVTAGFLLNNWQSEKQDELLEVKYLNGFLRDAEKNIDELQKAITSDSLWLAKMRRKLIKITKKTITVDSAEATIESIASLSAVSFQTGVYENITNSGNLNIIRNYELREKIVDYYAKINDVKFIDDYFFKYFDRFTMPFIYKHFSLINGKFADAKIIKTVEFENTIAGFFSLKRQQKGHYEALLKKSLALKEELKKLDLKVD